MYFLGLKRNFFCSQFCDFLAETYENYEKNSLKLTNIDFSRTLLQKKKKKLSATCERYIVTILRKYFDDILPDFRENMCKRGKNAQGNLKILAETENMVIFA